MKPLVPFALLFCALAACGQKPVFATDAQRYLYQRDAARMQVLQSQAQPLLDEQNKLKADVCKAASIELALCKIDWETGAVTGSAPKADPKKK